MVTEVELKVTISQEIIDWLSSELTCSEEDAQEFAQNFISLLRASGGLSVKRSRRSRQGFPYTIAALTKALTDLLDTGLCDLCYEDPCDPMFCECPCHTRIAEARDRADQALRDAD